MLKMVADPMLNTQLTFIMIKSDATNNCVVDEIMKIIRASEFVIYYGTLDVIRLTPEQIKAFYAEHVDRPYFPDLMKSVNGGVIPLIVFYTKDDEPAFSKMRALIGATDSRKAAPGTIRADFGGHNFNPEAPLAENAIHASDSLESANREIQIIFPQLVVPTKVEQTPPTTLTDGKKPYVEKIQVSEEDK